MKPAAWILFGGLVCANPAAAQATPPSPSSIASPTDPSVVTPSPTPTVDPSWFSSDPNWASVVKHEAKEFRFGPRSLIRVTPYLDSPYGPIPVEGGDRVVVFSPSGEATVRPSVALVPASRFRMDGTAALLKAIVHVPHSAITKSNAHETKNLARPVWLATRAGIRPAWRVRVPTLRLTDMRDVWIDASTGALLRSAPAAKSASAHARGAL